MWCPARTMFAQSIFSELLETETVFGFLGIEVVIFAGTLIVAFLFRHVNTKRFQAAKLAQEKLPKVTISSPRDHHQHSSTQERYEVDPKDPSADLPKRYEHSKGPGKMFCSQETLAKDLDDLAVYARDPQSNRIVHRVMQMYNTLIERLKEKSMNLPEAAILAHHSALDVYSSLVYCVIRANRFNMVEKLLDDMSQQGVVRPLHFYESTMKQLAGVKKYKLALNVYDRMEADDLQPSPVTLSCLINFAVEVGEVQRAITFFDVLSSLTTPTIRAYMSVLRVHSMRQDWHAAIGTISEMKRRNVPVDTLALNVALGTGVAANRLQEVEATIAEATNADIVSYNTLLKGHAQCGNIFKAEQVFQSLLHRGLRPNAISFNTMMDASVRAGDIARSWHLFNSMERAGFKPDRFTCSIMVKSLYKIDEICPSYKERYVQYALNMIRKVANCSPHPDKTFLSQVLHSILEVCDDNGALAQQVVSEMRLHEVAIAPSAQRKLMKVIKRIAKYG